MTPDAHRPAGRGRGERPGHRWTTVSATPAYQEVISELAPRLLAAAALLDHAAGGRIDWRIARRGARTHLARCDWFLELAA